MKVWVATAYYAYDEDIKVITVGMTKQLADDAMTKQLDQLDAEADATVSDLYIVDYAVELEVHET